MRALADGCATLICAQVTDVWVQALMKGAAKCNKHCKLHTCVSKVLAECVSAHRPCVGHGCLTVATHNVCWWVGALGSDVAGGYGIVGRGCVLVGMHAMAACACVQTRMCVCDWHGVVLFANLKQLGMLKAACVRHALLHDRGAAVRVCPCGVVWWPSAPAEFKHIGRQRNCNKQCI